MGSYDKKLAEGTKPYLEDGETFLAAIIAQPRGTTQAIAGYKPLGHSQVGKHAASAAEAGFEITSPMALAVTDRRLLALAIGSPIGLGIGGKVKGLSSAVPLSAVDSIEVKRLAVGKTLHVTIDGNPFVLEAGAGADAKGLVAAFEQAKNGG
jgi:hypothetical protein